MLTFNETHTFTRPITATYIDINGDEQTAAINEPRFEYAAGLPIGLKFGAQDNATCPLTTNWYTGKAGTYIIRAYRQWAEVSAHRVQVKAGGNRESLAKHLSSAYRLKLTYDDAWELIG